MSFPPWARTRRFMAGAGAGPTMLAAALLLAALLSLAAVRIAGVHGAGDARLTVVLQSSDVGWRGSPSSTVSVQLVRSGRAMTTVERSTDLTGRVSVPMGAAILPGDFVAAAVDGRPVVSATIPGFTISLRGRGRGWDLVGPASSSATITVTSSTGERIATTRRLDEAGAALLGWPTGWDHDAAAHMTASIPAGGNVRVIAHWRSAYAELRFGRPEVSVLGPPGRPVTVTVTGRDGRRGSGIARTAGPGGPPRILTMRREDHTARPWRASDTTTVTVAGDAPRSLRLPFMSVRMIPAQDRITGAAPPGRRLDIDIATTSPDRPSERIRMRRAVTVTADGRFSLDLMDVHDLGARSEVWAWLEMSHFSVGAPGRSDRVTATLDSHLLEGTGPLGSSVALSLKSGGGTGPTVADAVTAVDAGGRFTVALTAGSEARPVRLEPGLRLLALWDRGGSGSLTLPNLVASVDRDDGAVIGVAPPGAPLRVWARRGERRASARIHAAGDGTFRWTPSDLRLEPGTSGWVAWDATAEVTVRRVWTVPHFAVHPGRAVVEGIVPDGIPSTASLWRQGFEIASGRGPTEVIAGGVLCERCNWSARLRSPDGYPSPVRPGDVLALDVGSQRFRVEVPSLAIRGNPATQVLRGHGPPDTPMTATVHDPGLGTRAVALSSDDSGVFRTRLRAEDPRMRVGQHIGLVALLEPVAFHADVHLAGLDIDLDDATVSGDVLPGATISAGLYGGGAAPRAQGGATADSDGYFQLALKDLLGGRITPVAGDTLVLRAGTRVTTTIIPELTIEASQTSDVVEGRATSGGRVRVSARRPDDDRGDAVQRLALRPRPDTWKTELSDRLDVAAGTEIVVRRSGDAGHVARRRVVLPLIEADQDRSTITGVASPGARVALTITRSGGVVHSAERAATPAGRFQAVLPLGALREGDRIVASWTEGERAPSRGTIDMEVAALDVGFTDDRAEIRGTAPGAESVRLRMTGDGHLEPRFTLPVASGGSFSAPLPEHVRPRAGSMIAASRADSEGHVTVAADRLPWLDVQLGRPSIVGRATPGRPLQIDIRRDGPVGGAANVIVGTTGSFVALLEGWRATAGDRIVLREPSGRITELAVPDLTATVDEAGDAIHGRGPVGSLIDVRLIALGQPSRTVEVLADEDGRWRIPASSLPAGLHIGIIRHVIARLQTPDGHLVTAQTSVGATPTPPATPAVGTPTPTRIVPTPTDGAPPTATSALLDVADRSFLPLVQRIGRISR